jgi:DNA-binding NtrC family response regulator
MNTTNLLLVDDERSFVEAMTQRLRGKGFKVTGAFSGGEALSRLEEDDGIDVVLLDVIMPGTDGIETIRAIKKTRPLVEIIMLTGHAEVASATEAMKTGAFDYLIKPCNMDELIFKIKEAVDRKKDREAKIFDARIKPYISRQERDELISRILDS